MHFENTELRRAMRALGFTNQSLADALSEVRTDGQRTSPATVSRWVSGAAPTEPALFLYLQERVKRKLLDQPVARLPKCTSIAIGGNKGGSGGSAVTALFALAAANIGYRVAYVAGHDTNPFFTEGTCPIKVSWFSDFEPINKSRFDFIFTDVRSRTFLLDEYASEAARVLDTHDFILVPCQLDRYEEVRLMVKAINFLENAEDSPPWALLPFSNNFDVPNLLEFAQQYAEWHPQIVRTALIHGGPFFTHGHFGHKEFADDSIKQLSFDVLRDAVGRIGIMLHEGNASRSLDQLTLGELLDLLGA